MRLSTNNEHAECFNNLILATAGSGHLAILDSTGSIDLFHNWLSQGWVNAHDILMGEISSEENISGIDPGIEDVSSQDCHLRPDSDCVDAGTDLPDAILPDHRLEKQYVMHQRYTERGNDPPLDMGAFELQEN